MAYSFDETGDYLTVADNAALTFPAGNWSLARDQWGNNAGTTYDYFLSRGTLDTNNSINAFVTETSEGTNNNKIQVQTPRQHRYLDPRYPYDLNKHYFNKYLVSLHVDA